MSISGRSEVQYWAIHTMDTPHSPLVHCTMHKLRQGVIHWNVHWTKKLYIFTLTVKCILHIVLLTVHTTHYTGWYSPYIAVLLYGLHCTLFLQSVLFAVYLTLPSFILIVHCTVFKSHMIFGTHFTQTHFFSKLFNFLKEKINVLSQIFT